MINIKSFGKSKNGFTANNSDSSGYANTIVSNKVNGVYLWGQYHDHQNDINGDIKTSGNINADGDITSQGDINANNANITEEVKAQKATFTGQINADDCHLTGDLSCVDVNCSNLSAAGDVEANDITSNTGNITNLVTDYLTVTKQAHFYELVIDKIKSTGGQIILSAANAKIDKVVETLTGYNLYWRKIDPETNKAIENEFVVNDQVICQTFNAQNGTSYNVENKYYWALVTDVGVALAGLDGENVDCNYITISKTTKDGTSVPEPGDEIVQLGYRGNDDSARQSAIILSAYKSPDPNAQAPSIVQYAGINTFSLNNKILNKIAADGTTLTGTFKVVTGNTTEDIINLINGTQPTIITDSDAVFVMVDTNNDLATIDDAQNLPYNIKLYNGNTLINYSSWTNNSYIDNGLQTVPLKPASTYTDTGLYISEVFSDGNGGCALDWNYINDGTGIYNYSLTIYIEWTERGTTYNTTKTIPVNVLVQGTSIAGADAELDRLQLVVGDATVDINDTLTTNIIAQIQHVKGDITSTVTDMSNYSLNITYNNGDVATATKNTTLNRFEFTDILNDFSEDPNPPTSLLCTLIKGSGQMMYLLDSVVIPVKFAAGSIFEVKEDAITAAVSNANSYTDSSIASVNLTAAGLTSRVTAIENNYVTTSVLTQTANQISLDVYDELKNKTGIDVQQGSITLNAATTTINGNLNLNQTNNGITVFDNDNTPRIQIQPSEIGSVDNYDTGTVNGILQQYYQSGQTNYNATFTKKKIGQYAASDTIGIRDIRVYMASYYNNNNANPLANTIQLTLNIYQEGNNTPLQTYTYTLSKTNAGVYTTNNTINYTAQSDAVYQVGATITCGDNVSASSYVYEELTYTVSRRVEHQTYIGVDGFVSNPAANCLMWAGSEELQLRWEQDGIRLNNNGLQRLPNLIQQNTLWLPFDNYTTVTDILSVRYTLNNNKYEYTINPITDKGVLMCSVPSFNQGGYSTHIYMPDYYFTYNDTTYTLPKGYKVTVYNSDTTTGSISDRMYLNVHYNNTSRQIYGLNQKLTLIHVGGGSWVI